jgi:hypothetical protein
VFASRSTYCHSREVRRDRALLPLATTTGSANVSVAWRKRFPPLPVGHVTSIPGRSFEIRFPDGDFEIDAGTRRPPPDVGDTLRRRGKLWKVTARSDRPRVTVQVERLEERRP